MIHHNPDCGPPGAPVCPIGVSVLKPLMAPLMSRLVAGSSRAVPRLFPPTKGIHVYVDASMDMNKIVCDNVDRGCAFETKQQLLLGPGPFAPLMVPWLS